jgi:hypothetical protein
MTAQPSAVKTSLVFGPEILITATPDLPGGVAKAKIVLIKTKLNINPIVNNLFYTRKLVISKN